jgi:hypothetical protein
MFIMLVVWSILLHIGVWYMDTLHDPLTYTQTAHLDQSVITDAQGHQYQIRAFVDQQNHLDLLVIPSPGSGETISKARIIPGPLLTGIGDPQRRAILTVTARGTLITVLAQGPLQAGWLDLTSYRQSQQWSVDAASQLPSSKGGK